MTILGAVCCCSAKASKRLGYPKRTAILAMSVTAKESKKASMSHRTWPTAKPSLAPDSRRMFLATAALSGVDFRMASSQNIVFASCQAAMLGFFQSMARR